MVGGVSMARMQRPKVEVVSDSALVPPANLVDPPPNRFTHVLQTSQPYYYGASAGKQPDGEFAIGTRVVLMGRYRGRMCRVIDGQGLYVLTACQGLANKTPGR